VCSICKQLSHGFFSFQISWSVFKPDLPGKTQHGNTQEVSTAWHENGSSFLVHSSKPQYF